MTGFDFDAAVRWRRFDPQKTLARRADSELPFLDEKGIGGQPLLLDTCVYIDQLHNRSPDILDRLVATRQVSHSIVAIQELMHTVGVLSPSDRRTPAAITAIRGLVRSIPPHRLHAPDIDVLGRAGLLSGILCRLRGHTADGKLRALHDCVLFLQAQNLGCAILTADVSDFDALLQLLPGGRTLFYRRKLLPARAVPG